MREIPFEPTAADIIGRMRHIPHLSGLGDVLLAEMVRLARLRTYAPEEVVIKQGANDVWFYFLVLGELLVVHNGVAVHRLKHFGEMFGEMALADHSPRSATVRAVTPSVCLALDAALFDSLAPSDRAALKGALNAIISANLAQRLREMDRKMAELEARA